MCWASGGEQAAEMTTTNSNANVVGIAVVAVADDDHAWFQRYGKARIEVANSVTANTQLHTTGTRKARRCDRASIINGCRSEQASTSAGQVIDCYGQLAAYGMTHRQKPGEQSGHA